MNLFDTLEQKDPVLTNVFWNWTNWTNAVSRSHSLTSVGLQKDEFQGYYDYVSSVSAFCIMFAVAYIISFGILYTLRNTFRQQKHDDEDDEEHLEEYTRGRLPFFLSTYICAVALLWLFVICLTLALSRNNTDAPALRLASIQRFWTLLVWMSIVALFVVTPFAFIYYEAEGFGRPNVGYAFSRCTETWIVLLILICLVSSDGEFGIG
jgi:amino acid transporter